MTNMPYRVVFLGTPQFAAPILQALAECTHVVLAVSQPDRPSGRGCKMCKPAVKMTAEALGIEVIQPETAKGRKFADRIAAFEPDFLVTAAYGRILGRRLLAVPKKCALNVHASLLPNYRGAAPAAWAVLNGELKSGVSIMKMDAELDAGPVFQRREIDVGENETSGELLERLSAVGAAAIVDTLRRFDTLTAKEQDHGAATYARMLTKRDGEIDWTRDAPSLHNHVRGMSPWPCAFTRFNADCVKIHASAAAESEGVFGTPGEVVGVTKQGIDVACGRGVLRLTALQAPGRKQMPAHAYLTGNPVVVGTTLG